MESSNADQIAFSALQAHKQGEYAKAIEQYLVSISLGTTRKKDVLINLASIYFQKSCYDECSDFARQALMLESASPKALELLGRAQLASGEVDDANTTFRRFVAAVTVHEHGKREVTNQLALCAQVFAESKNTEEARSLIASLDKGLLNKEGLIHYSWASLVLASEENISAARELLLPFEDCIPLRAALTAYEMPEATATEIMKIACPRGYTSQHEKVQMEIESALALSRISRHGHAIQLFEEIGVDRLGHRELSVLGDCYFSMGALEKACLCYTGVLEGKGYTLSEREKLRLAYQLSRISLFNGDFSARVWVALESRFRLASKEVLGKLDYIAYRELPRWQPDKRQTRLLLGTEQGLGEELLFSGLVECFEEKYPEVEVSLEVRPKLRDYMQERFARNRIFYTGQELCMSDARFDSFMHIGSICQYLGVSLYEYLERRKKLYEARKNSRAGQLNTGSGAIRQPRIGIYWKSSNSPESKKKSMKLSHFKKLWELPIEIIPLQDSMTEEEISIIRELKSDIPEIDLRDDIKSIASVVRSLDCLVTVSSSIAHIACSEGIDTVVLVPERSKGIYWYWGGECGRSRIYPNAQIISGVDIDPDKAMESAVSSLQLMLKSDR